MIIAQIGAECVVLFYGFSLWVHNASKATRIRTVLEHQGTETPHGYSKFKARNNEHTNATRGRSLVRHWQAVKSKKKNEI